MFFQIASAEVKEVALVGLPTSRSSSSEIAMGLSTLYPKDAAPLQIEKQVEHALAFQDQIYSAIQSAQSHRDGRIAVRFEKRRLKGNFVTETTITFPSLFQRPGQHKANTVIAKVYESTTEAPSCDYKYPASVFLHHIHDELDMIEDAGAFMAAGVLSQSGTIAVLHMPHYGQRKEPNEQFLNSDYAKFRENLAQLVLDAHVLRLALAEMPKVDRNNISLSGISLGAVLGLTVGAFDQGFSRYASLVGGGNLANILSNRATNKPESEVAIALKGSAIEEAAIRDQLAAVDPIVWAHRMKSKNVFMLSASRDNIVDYRNSVIPMVDLMKANGNTIQHILNEDEHSPTGSALKKMKKVFLPMLRFIVADRPSIHEACAQ